MIGGSAESNFPLLVKLAKLLQVPVLSVNYRLAPEHPFPDGIQDCFDVYKWVLEKGFEYGI